MSHELLSPRQVAALLGISLSKAHQLMPNPNRLIYKLGAPPPYAPGSFPRTIMVGGNKRLKRVELEAWIDRELEAVVAPDEVVQYPRRMSA